MKIMWVSVAPWVGTGYGQQTSLIVPRLHDAGHDVAVSCTHGLIGTAMDWNGVKVYGCDGTGHNKRLLRHHVRKHFGDEDVQVITLYDLWPLVDKKWGGMIADFDGLNVASWTPVDHDPVPPGVRAGIDAYQVRTIAMSRFGEQALRDVGYDPLYAPHAVETSIFQPIDDQQTCRESMGLPPDKFVVGMVANNQGINPPRKAFPQVLQAFSILRQRHDDVLLYLHTEVTGVYDGLNLVALANVFGIPDDALAACPQTAYLNNDVSKSRLAVIYNAMDVLANPSYGEGFGIPIIEAQACGVPVIVSEWTSMPELCGAGWRVGGQPWYNPTSASMWLDPDTEQILAALEQAYENRGNQELKEKAREFALGYDADTVFQEHWEPTLEALARPRVVPPLPSLNREQRRKLAKEKAAA